MRIRKRIAGAALAALAVAGLASHDGTPAEAPPPDVEGIQPAASRAPVEPGAPQGRWLTARVRRPAALRAGPGGRVLSWLSTHTEFGSPRVLGVVAQRGSWLRVLSPQLRNGQSGWIASGDTTLGATDLAVTVDRSSRELELRDGARLIDRFQIGVGGQSTPTPVGRFAITDRLHMGGASPYGCCALALTGHQPHLPPGWSGGDRLAIHGTLEPGTLGKAASLGCVRAPRSGLRVLIRRVPLGTPVFIHR
jgi:lipoprotein-anchoring transpeptidase ErfK/SrfK